MEKAKEFLTDEVLTVEEALEGAKLILAEEISEVAEYREKTREDILKEGILFSKETKKAKELDEKKVYVDYYNYQEVVAKIPAHRILAVNRGENEDILSVSIKFEDIKKEQVEQGTFNK